MPERLPDADVQEVKDRWSDEKYDSNHEVAKRDVLRLVEEVERTRESLPVLGGE